MWSFVQHSFMLQVLNFNAGMVQDYMLLGYKATSTGSEFHTCDRNILPSCSRVLWYDRNSSSDSQHGMTGTAVQTANTV